MPAPVEQLLADYSPELRELFVAGQALMQRLVPTAVEKIDLKARLLGYSFQPGTYKGLVLALTPAKNHVSIIFSHGVELTPLDAAGLLEGTGKRARHIEVTTKARLTDPDLEKLIQAAAALTASKMGLPPA